jgi:DNA topoisomerase I
VTYDRAIEILEAKLKADREKHIATFDEQEPVIEILNGRWGPYIKVGKNNVKIPKDTDPTSLTRKDCEKLIEAAPKKKTGGARRSKKK